MNIPTERINGIRRTLDFVRPRLTAADDADRQLLHEVGGAGLKRKN